MEDYKIMQQQDLKKAKTDYPVHPLLSRRWSPRAFDENYELSDLELKSLFEAARWSPSSFNEQPWRFMLASRKNRSEFETMLETLDPFNAEWAVRSSALILAVAKTFFEQDGRENLHAEYDLGQAVANLTIQATELDLHVHQMAGFDREKARKIFKIPDNFKPITVCAVGKLGNPDILSTELKKMELAPRSRNTTNVFVYSREWGVSAKELDY